MGRKFFITDVFSQGKFSGNQLATVVDCDGLDTAAMQAIALEFNYSETTFLLGGDAESGFDVRIFTPKSELPFAGHPTLGSAFILREVLHRQTEPNLTLNLAVGKIPVVFGDDGILWMTQNQPEFGQALPSDGQAGLDMALGLSIEPSEIDTRFPIQYVSTGIGFIIVPMVSMDVLRRCKQRPTMEDGVLIFAPEGYTSRQSLGARMLAAGLGIPEDPATGSANGCLAAYLLEHKYFESNSIDLEVGQGYEINRPSSLYLKASKQPVDGQFDIDVGGRVNLVAEGTLML